MLLCVCFQLKSSVQQCSQDREELVRQVGTLQHQLEQERRSHLAEVSGAPSADPGLCAEQLVLHLIVGAGC